MENTHIFSRNSRRLSNSKGVGRTKLRLCTHISGWEHSRLQYRRKSIDVVFFFCCEAADEMLTCSLLLGTLFEREPAVSDAGAHLWLRRPLPTCAINGSLRACEAHGAVRTGCWQVFLFCATLQHVGFCCFRLLLAKNVRFIFGCFQLE